MAQKSMKGSVRLSEGGEGAEDPVRLCFARCRKREGGVKEPVRLCARCCGRLLKPVQTLLGSS